MKSISERLKKLGEKENMLVSFNLRVTHNIVNLVIKGRRFRYQGCAIFCISVNPTIQIIRPAAHFIQSNLIYIGSRGNYCCLLFTK